MPEKWDLLRQLDEWDQLGKYLQLPDELRLHAVGSDSGMFLMMLTALLRPKRVLELGSGCGYSTLWLSRGLGRDGVLVACEIDDRKRYFAQQLTKRYGFDRIRWHANVATAIKELEGSQVDFLFLDLPKEFYKPVFDQIGTKLLKGKWVLVADNMLSHRTQTTPLVETLENLGLPHMLVPIGKGLEVVLASEWFE